MLERKKRLKELLAKLDSSLPKISNIKKHPIKKTGTYSFMKHRERLSLTNNKTYVFKSAINLVNKKYIFNLRDHSILRRNKLINEILAQEDFVFNSKISQTTLNINKIRDEKFRKFLKSVVKHNKFSKISESTKINLIQRATSKNITKRSLRIREIRGINAKNLLNKTGKQIAYKLK